MTPGWNAPQGVENVHTLCAGNSESDDRGNNIYIKRLETSFMYQTLYKISHSNTSKLLYRLVAMQSHRTVIFNHSITKICRGATPNFSTNKHFLMGTLFFYFLWRGLNKEMYFFIRNDFFFFKARS